VSDEKVRRTAEPDVELFAVSARGATITRSDATGGEGCRDGRNEKCARERESMRASGVRRVRRDRGFVLDEVRRVPAALVRRELRGAGGRRVCGAEEQQRPERTRADEARRRAPGRRAPSEMRALHAYGNCTEPVGWARLWCMAIA
jgi:hypothetical protein